MNIQPKHRQRAYVQGQRALHRFKATPPKHQKPPPKGRLTCAIATRAPIMNARLGEMLETAHATATEAPGEMPGADSDRKAWTGPATEGGTRCQDSAHADSCENSPGAYP